LLSQYAKVVTMRVIMALLAAAVAVAPMISAPSASAEPPGQPAPVDPVVTSCNDPSCTPGIAPNIVLGSHCNNTTYYAFGVTSWGRLVFCGSPRRYEPRWFRATEMHGIKLQGGDCLAHDGEMAQAPDGLFLTCVARDGATRWERGDL
jgi:hypothetical protein